ncbi:MAG: branched-chain amino acid transaminase [Acidobacteriota bacterium]|nr:branched-chain amino acid transaminase [Acidobacteriota bacterium]
MIDMTNFPKAKVIWYQGKFHDWSELTLHSMTHALHYGTSVFEGIRAYPTAKGPAVFRLPEHVDRFLVSASVIKMQTPYPKEQIAAAILDTVRANGLESCYIRPLFFYSYGNLGLVPKASPVELVIAAWEWGAYHGDGAAAGLSVYLLPWRRLHHSQIDMRAKLGGAYVQSSICGLEARDKGCDEAVFLNIEGRIAEGPGENIFTVKDGILKTNARSESILEGITRTSVLEIAADLGYKTAVGPITKNDFLAADEAFFTGTAVEVVPITRLIDGSEGATPKPVAIGTGRAGEVCGRIRETYLDIVRGRNSRYEKWLTYVPK